MLKNKAALPPPLLPVPLLFAPACVKLTARYGTFMMQ
jgi:hypothetical protein